MPEVFAWREGQCFVWTGNSTVSALTAYAQNINASIAYGWNNRRLVTGTYQDVLTGQRADVQIGAMYTPDATIQKFAALTALTHMHLRHSSLGGTAGIFLWSGRIDRIDLQGSEANVYSFTVAYHSNIITAYP